MEWVIYEARDLGLDSCFGPPYAVWGVSMASTVWKGHLSFGLISIPVKLHRAARAEKVSFRQLHGSTASRVKQVYIREDEPEPDEEPEPSTSFRPTPIDKAAFTT